MTWCPASCPGLAEGRGGSKESNSSQGAEDGGRVGREEWSPQHTEERVQTSLAFTPSLGVDLRKLSLPAPGKSRDFSNRLFPLWNHHLKTSATSIAFRKDTFLSNCHESFQVLSSTGNAGEVQHGRPGSSLNHLSVSPHAKPSAGWELKKTPHKTRNHLPELRNYTVRPGNTQQTIVGTHFECPVSFSTCWASS